MDADSDTPESFPDVVVDGFTFAPADHHSRNATYVGLARWAVRLSVLAGHELWTASEQNHYGSGI